MECENYSIATTLYHVKKVDEETLYCHDIKECAETIL